MNRNRTQQMNLLWQAEYNAMEKDMESIRMHSNAIDIEAHLPKRVGGVSQYEPVIELTEKEIMHLQEFPQREKRALQRQASASIWAQSCPVMPLISKNNVQDAFKNLAPQLPPSMGSLQFSDLGLDASTSRVDFKDPFRYKEFVFGKNFAHEDKDHGQGYYLSDASPTTSEPSSPDTTAGSDGEGHFFSGQKSSGYNTETDSSTRVFPPHAIQHVKTATVQCRPRRIGSGRILRN